MAQVLHGSVAVYCGQVAGQLEQGKGSREWWDRVMKSLVAALTQTQLTGISAQAWAPFCQNGRGPGGWLGENDSTQGTVDRSLAQHVSPWTAAESPGQAAQCRVLQASQNFGLSRFGFAKPRGTQIPNFGLLCLVLPQVLFVSGDPLQPPKPPNPATPQAPTPPTFRPMRQECATVIREVQAVAPEIAGASGAFVPQRLVASMDRTLRICFKLQAGTRALGHSGTRALGIRGVLEPQRPRLPEARGKGIFFQASRCFAQQGQAALSFIQLLLLEPQFRQKW